MKETTNSRAYSLTSLQQGDPNAWDQYVLEHHQRLVYKAILQLHAPSLAEDAVQESLFKGFAKVQGFRAEEMRQFHAWINRILTNTCIDYNDKNFRSLFCTSLEHLDGEWAGDENTEKAALRRVALKSVFATLDAESREEAEMWLEGCTIREIVEHFNRPQPAVTRRNYAFRSKLKELL